MIRHNTIIASATEHKDSWSAEIQINGLVNEEEANKVLEMTINYIMSGFKGVEVTKYIDER